MSMVEKNPSPQNGDEITIDLLQMVKLLWQNVLWILLGGIILGVAVFFGVHLLVTPTYQAKFTAYINNRTQTDNLTSLTSSDLTAARSLATTYAQIITSSSVLELAGEESGTNLTYGQLKSMVKASTVPNTEILQVTVETTDPQLAKTLADSIAAVAPIQVSTIVEGSSMRLIDRAQLPTSIYQPNYTKNAAIGFLLGMLLVAAFLIVKELLDDRVKSEQELENSTGIKVIGAIPDIVAAASHKSSYGYSYGQRKPSGDKKGGKKA